MSSIPYQASVGVLPYADFNNQLGGDWKVDRTITDNGLPLLVTDIGKEVCEEICEELRSEGYQIDWYAKGNLALVKAIGNLPELRAVWRAKVREKFAE